MSSINFPLSQPIPEILKTIKARLRSKQEENHAKPTTI